MQNNVIRIRIASLYGSQRSSVVFACKIATLESELLVSMDPRLRLLICAGKTMLLASEILASMSPSPHVWCWAFTTATL